MSELSSEEMHAVMLDREGYHAAAGVIRSLLARLSEVEREHAELKAHHDDMLDSDGREIVNLISRAVKAENKLIEVERETIERCAKVAEGPIYKEHYRGSEGGNWAKDSRGNTYGAGRIGAAAAIRALTAKAE